MPEDPVCWYNLAVIALCDGKTEHALKWINNSLSIKEDFFEALFVKGLCAVELGDEKAAQNIFTYAHDISFEKFDKWRNIQVKTDNILSPVKPEG